jgi:hypothetical protein
LTKITRVKKGLVNRFLYQDAIKCPQCQEIILLQDELRRELRLVQECQESKDKQKASKHSHGDGKKSGNKHLCQICISSMQKVPMAAQFQCLTCKNVILCPHCRGKHKMSHKIVAYVTKEAEA